MPTFAIPQLMAIESPRADGDPGAPRMGGNFDVPGLMQMQTPRSDADGVVPPVLAYGTSLLSYDGSPLIYNEET